MKKIMILLALTISVVGSTEVSGYHGRGGGGFGGGFAAGALTGAVLSNVGRRDTVVIQQPVYEEFVYEDDAPVVVRRYKRDRHGRRYYHDEYGDRVYVR